MVSRSRGRSWYPEAGDQSSPFCSLEKIKFSRSGVAGIELLEPREDVDVVQLPAERSPML